MAGDSGWCRDASASDYRIQVRLWAECEDSKHTRMVGKDMGKDWLLV